MVKFYFFLGGSASIFKIFLTENKEIFHKKGRRTLKQNVLRIQKTPYPSEEGWISV